jgi:ribonuclease P protein component
MGWGFGRERRLSGRREFDRVFRKGRRLDGRLFVLIAIRNGQPAHRLGIATGRKLGGAVARNRARRLLRDSFRRLEPGRGEAFDLVIVAKAALVGSTQAEVDREFRERLRRLSGDGESRSTSAAAPD